MESADQKLHLYLEKDFQLVLQYRDLTRVVRVVVIILVFIIQLRDKEYMEEEIPNENKELVERDFVTSMTYFTFY